MEQKEWLARLHTGKMSTEQFEMMYANRKDPQMRVEM